MTSSKDNYNLLIIGGGPGGYVAAIRATQKGLKTGVLELDNLGGICLNWGCIPTKALLKNAELMNSFQRAEEFGFNIKDFSFDFNKIIKRSRDVADINSKGVEYLFKKNKIDHTRGFGTLKDANTIAVLDKNGREINRVSAEKIIIATGGRPRPFPKVEFDGKKILSSKEAMILKKVPKKMIIIGAGAIGVEFSYFYNTFGTEVHLIEMMPQISSSSDCSFFKAR